MTATHRRERPIPPLAGWARAYFVVITVQLAVIGYFCAFRPDTFHTEAYVPVRRVLTLGGWGVLHILTAVNGLFVLVTRSERWARVVLAAAVFLDGAWFAGFLVAADRGLLLSPLVPVWLGTLTFTSLIVSARPLRPNPFDPYVEQARDLASVVVHPTAIGDTPDAPPPDGG